MGVDDPAGDASGGGLDITRAVLANRDYAVTTRVVFDDLVRSDLVISVDRRRGEGLRLVSAYRPNGTTRSFVLRGAFTDSGPSTGQVPCPGVRVTWDDETNTAKLRLPSRCFNADRYGAVRFAVLTERRGRDADYFPETEDGDIGSSPWIPRG